MHSGSSHAETCNSLGQIEQSNSNSIKCTFLTDTDSTSAAPNFASMYPLLVNQILTSPAQTLCNLNRNKIQIILFRETSRPATSPFLYIYLLLETAIHSFGQLILCVLLISHQVYKMHLSPLPTKYQLLRPSFLSTSSV